MIERNGSGSGLLAGERVSYADLSLFHLVRGLQYAFPKTMERSAAGREPVLALADRIENDARLADYLGSDRRLAFNEDGLFRHYPELDG